MTDSWEDCEDTTVAEPPSPAQSLALARIRARAHAATELAPGADDAPSPTAQAITILARPSLSPPPGVTLLGVLPRSAACAPAALLGVVPRSAVEAVPRVPAEGHRHQLLDEHTTAAVSPGTAGTHLAIDAALAAPARRLCRDLLLMGSAAVATAIVVTLVGYLGLL